jgi:transposase InsO family protein
MPQPSMNGDKYFLTIVDDHSRHTWALLLKSKYDVRHYLQIFIQSVETQFDKKVKVIRSDNGPEFLMAEFFNSRGIAHHTSCVETPQQNGIVERKYQHILSTCRAIMFQSAIPIVFWSYAISHSVYLINRLPSLKLHNISPYELLYGKKPYFSSLKVFCCLMYAITLTRNRTKLDSRARSCVFLG